MSDTATGTPMPTEQEFGELVQRANAGDVEALKALRTTLDEHPAIYQRVGDMAAHAEAMLIQLISAGNQLMVESLSRKLRDMRDELMGSEPSQLERMAVERVMATWLQLQYADYRVAQTPTTSLPQTQLELRCQQHADERYAAALRSLAELRRLLPNGDAKRPLRIYPSDSGKVSAGRVTA